MFHWILWTSRTRSSETGMLDFLRSLSIPFVFLLRSLSVPFPFLFAFPKRSGNAFPVRLLLSGTVATSTFYFLVLNLNKMNLNVNTSNLIYHIIVLFQNISINPSHVSFSLCQPPLRATFGFCDSHRFGRVFFQGEEV